MSEQETPQGTTPQGGGTPEPPPPPPPPAEGGGAASSNRTLMVVLSYLWILFLIPLLVEKQDREVQWHAKHGLVLTVAEIILQLILNVITATGIGCLFAIFIPLVFLGFAVVRLICIIKGVNGERFMIPVISQYAEKF